MDSSLVFAIICLAMGSLVAVQLPRRLRASDEGIVGRALLALILLSLMCFLLSLGGAGIAIATNQADLAHTFEGVAVISGFATLGSPVLAIAYGVVRFLVRRAVGAETR